MSWNANFHFEYGEVLNDQKKSKTIFYNMGFRKRVRNVKNARYVH